MAEGTGSDSADDEEVVEFSKDQRAARPGEPVCIVCGRYGAYICDATDQDVCSIQCKQAHLYSVQEVSTETSGTEAPINANTLFEHIISDKLLANVQAMCSCNSPTHLQAQVISAMHSGNDVRVCSSSSRERHLSYLIPAIQAVHDSNSYSHSDTECSYPVLLIIAPSRHCCAQLQDLTKQLISGLPNMRTALIVGGAPLANQIYRLKSGIQIVIATTDRLLDILVEHSSCIDFSSLSILIVEELDVLLGAGLQDQLFSIITTLPEDRQTVVLYSNSSNGAMVDKLSKKISEHHMVVISHGNTPDTASAVTQPAHEVWWTEEGAKKKKLLSLLADDKLYSPPLVVYVNSKMGSVLLAEAVHKELGIAVLSIHGNMSIEKRDAVVKDFTSGKVEVLITSVMLTILRDSLQCQQVIIFDFPQSMDSFSELVSLILPSIKGQVISFINKSNHLLFQQLTDYMKPLGVRLPPQLITCGPRQHHANKTHSSSGHPSYRKRKKCSIDLTKQDNLVNFIKKNRV